MKRKYETMPSGDRNEAQTVFFISRFLRILCRIQVDVVVLGWNGSVSAKMKNNTFSFWRLMEKRRARCAHHAHTHKTLVKIHHHVTNCGCENEKKCMEYECLSLFRFRFIYAINSDILSLWLFCSFFFLCFHFGYITLYRAVTEITKRRNSGTCRRRAIGNISHFQVGVSMAVLGSLEAKFSIKILK